MARGSWLDLMQTQMLDADAHTANPRGSGPARDQAILGMPVFASRGSGGPRASVPSYGSVPSRSRLPSLGGMLGGLLCRTPLRLRTSSTPSDACQTSAGPTRKAGSTAGPSLALAVGCCGKVSLIYLDPLFFCSRKQGLVV